MMAELADVGNTNIETSTWTDEAAEQFAAKRW